MASDTCPFCEYVRGEKDLPEGKSLSGRGALAFSPLSPAARGHMLVVPSRHVERITELDPFELSQLMNLVSANYELIEHELKPDGMNLVIQDREAGGMSIEHLHIHLIPRWHNDGRGYRFTPRGYEP